MKKVEAHLILNDLRSGLGDIPIMEKYGLSPAQYLDILNKLKNLDLGRQSGVESRIQFLENETVIDNLRQWPRCYLTMIVVVSDIQNPKLSGELVNLSEAGCQTVGLNAQVGEQKTLVIHVDKLENLVKSFSFTAECRWASVDDQGDTNAGFFFVDMPTRNLIELRKLIELVGLCDS